MAANKLTLATNVPLPGMLKTVRWFENEYGRSLILGIEVPHDAQGVSMGVYQAGLGSVFVGEEQAPVLQNIGAAMQTAAQQKYGPGWKVLGVPLIQVLKLEQGKEKWTTITRIDGVAAPVAVPPQAQMPPQAAGMPPGTNNYAAPTLPVGGTPMQPEAPVQQPKPQKTAEQLKRETLRDWKRIATAYMQANRIAATALSEATGVPVEDLDQRSIATEANSIMIEVGRSGLLQRTYAGIFKTNGAAKPPPAPEDQIGPGEGIGEDDDDLPF